MWLFVHRCRGGTVRAISLVSWCMPSGRRPSARWLEFPSESAGKKCKVFRFGVTSGYDDRVGVPVMRLTSVIMSLFVASCSTTWDAFRIANQDACTNHPLDCGSGKVCSYETRQCQPQNCRQSGFCWESPRPQLFSPRAIYGSSASDLWMLGTREIYRASGSTITPVITELPVRMNAIVGIAPDNILFLGEQGTILSANYIAPTVSVDDLRMAS